MNAIPKFDPKALVDANLLKLAQDILEGVESGRITGLGVVYQTKDGVTPITWGSPLMLYLGCDLMKDDIKALLKGNTSGKILRAN